MISATFEILRLAAHSSFMRLGLMLAVAAWFAATPDRAAAAATCQIDSGYDVVAQGVQTRGYDSQMGGTTPFPIYLATNAATGAWKLFRCTPWGKDDVLSGVGLVSSQSAIAPASTSATTTAYNPGYCRNDIMRNLMNNQTVCGPFASLHGSLASRAKQEIRATGFIQERKDQKADGAHQTAHMYLYVDRKGGWSVVVRHLDRGDIGLVWAIGKKMAVQQRLSKPVIRITTGLATRPMVTVANIPVFDANWMKAGRACSAPSSHFPVSASGRITRFNTSPSRQAASFTIRGNPGSNWQMDLSLNEQCRTADFVGANLAFRDYSGAKWAAGQLHPPKDGLAGADETCTDANALFRMVSSASGVPSTDVRWCQKYFALDRELAQRGLEPAMGGFVQEAAHGRYLYYMIYASRSGQLAIVQVEQNRAAVIVAEGDGFTVAPAIIEPLRQQTAAAAQQAEQRAREAEARKIAQQQAAERAAQQAAADREARRRAELARLAELDRKGISTVQVAGVIVNSTNAADASKYFGDWVHDHALSTVGLNFLGIAPSGQRDYETHGGGKAKSECWRMHQSGGCLYTMGGKAAGVSFSYSAKDCIECGQGIDDIVNSAVRQGFKLVSERGGPDSKTRVYRRASLCMVSNYTSSSREVRETDKWSSETGRYVRETSVWESVSVMSGSLASVIGSGKECAG